MQRGTKRIYAKLKKIILDQDVGVEIRSRTAQHVCGLIEPDRDEIIILKNQDNNERAITLIHELLHYQYPQIDNEEIIEHNAKKIYRDLPKAERGFLEFIVSPGDKF